MKENFVREIEHLLSFVPTEQWRDPAGVCGVMYDFMPWHKASSLTVQTREDDVNDPAAWKYYFRPSRTLPELRLRSRSTSRAGRGGSCTTGC